MKCQLQSPTAGVELHGLNQRLLLQDRQLEKLNALAYLAKSNPMFNNLMFPQYPLIEHP